MKKKATKKVSKVPTVRIPARAKKSTVKGKRRAKPVKPARARNRVGQQFGAPPSDMLPPQMEDTRPVPTSATKVAGAEPPQSVNTSVTTSTTGDSQTAPAATSTLTPAIEPMVQGASCTWIGPMSATVEDSATGIPLCPHCGGHLISAVDEETMRLGFEAFELGAYSSINPPPRPHPNYRKLVSWMRSQDKCWTTIEAAASGFHQATGILVDPT
jgi:hypothetical protein